MTQGGILLHQPSRGKTRKVPFGKARGPAQAPNRRTSQKRVGSLAPGPNRAALTSEGAAYKGDLSSLDLIQNFLPVSPSKLGSRSVFSSLPQ
jgi:hypothetical protein